MAIHELLKNEFLNCDQMRELFQAHGVNTISNWVKTGRLPQPVCFGGHGVWPVEALKLHIQARCLAHGYTETEVAGIFARANLTTDPLTESTAKRLCDLLENFVVPAAALIDATATKLLDEAFEAKLLAYERGAL